MSMGTEAMGGGGRCREVKGRITLVVWKMRCRPGWYGFESQARMLGPISQVVGSKRVGVWKLVLG